MSQLFQPFALIFNSFTLALAMGFLLILLWYDVRRSVNQFFALFLILVQVWNIGFLLKQVSTFIDDPDLNRFALGIEQSGLVGASIALYALMTALVGVQPRRFRVLIAAYLVVGIGYILYLINSVDLSAGLLQIRSFSAFFFVVFDLLTVYTTWRFRRKLRNPWLVFGIVFFVFGQAIGFLNSSLGVNFSSTTVSSIGALVISFFVIQRELIAPLLERGDQLESLHEVSLAITSRIATDAVLSEIASRAASWLEADGAGIFLTKGDCLELVAIHNLPATMLNTQVQMGSGVAGTVAATKESIYLENYPRDWHGEDELELARETFGSVICVPLIYDERVIGALMVIAGARGHLLDREDRPLLELLAAQAAVAISYGDLFNEQRSLTEQLAIAHEQLGTVLRSTDNPVLAVDRSLNLIFTNPAAELLFGLDTIHSRANVQTALPRAALPKDFRAALRSIRQQKAYRYEIELDGKVFLCHVASLGDVRIEGFVAVLNDITELKELDRMKSEMIRMTSHDLKNPLQAALVNMDLLHEDLGGIDNEEVHVSVRNIERQLGKMRRIIAGILDLERLRMGANATEKRSFDLIIQDALDELRDMAAEHTIALHAEVSPDTPEFVGDLDQFERALINLIENAIKFNRPGGEVRVSARPTPGGILLSVQDTGIGIPPDVQNRVFDRFYRGQQQGAEHISGSGLGLSLVKAVVENHNGRIWLESHAGTGTSFFIQLPMNVSVGPNVYTD